MPRTAPTSIETRIHHGAPIRSIAYAIGAGMLSSLYGTIPTRTADTTTYSSVQTASEPRMPIGMSRWGVFDSCAAVETVSNPMQAKNTRPAPRNTPDQPYVPHSPALAGVNRGQLAPP